MGTDLFLHSRKKTSSFILKIFALVALAVSCKSVVDRQDVRPRMLRDVPAQNLAYRFDADVSPPADPKLDDTVDKSPAVQNDFNLPKRQNDALIRTVVSPDGRRVLALYGTADEPASSFRIDLYTSDGQFLRNVIPPTISCVFPDTVAWSPDGSHFNFIAYKRTIPSPSPTPLEDVLPETSGSPVPQPSIAPAFPPVASFNTEQIYICDRDGYDLKPLTSREGLIYFYFAWAPDGHALVALACKEDEWNAREHQHKSPAGRPRLIEPDGKERLLDDGLTDALPVWSPDASKVATAFDTDIAIYDAATNKPTQARLPLGDQLIKASIAYEQKTATKKADPPKNSNSKSQTPSPSPASTSSQAATPASFNPIVRLEWSSPERLYFKTAYVLLMPGEPINTFQRWHSLQLTAQAAVLK
jgi:dipeptidyl aminopeptidase/acylaminoacyl peptidase